MMQLQSHNPLTLGYPSPSCMLGLPDQWQQWASYLLRAPNQTVVLRNEVIELFTTSFSRILMRLLPIWGFGFSMVDSMLNSRVLV